MTERIERTSPEVATFAAKVMKMDDAALLRRAYTKPEQFRAMAASPLTQMPDKPSKATSAAKIETE
jgi:hypothetical protein